MTARFDDWPPTGRTLAASEEVLAKQTWEQLAALLQAGPKPLLDLIDMHEHDHHPARAAAGK